MPLNHILIVGGTKGAGRVATRQFLADGYAVSVIARRMPNSAAAEPGADYYDADVANRAAVRSVVRSAVARKGKFASVVFFPRYRGDGDAWTGELATGLTAVRDLIDLLVIDFKLRNCSIVLVSSVNGELISRQLTAGYHVAKAGMRQLVRYYAVMLGPRGIRVNSVSPGTYLKDESKSFFLKDKKLIRLYEKMIPLGRMCTAEEVVHVLAFLCSAKASYVTGQDIVIDGGLTSVYQETLARELTASSKARATRRRR